MKGDSAPTFAARVFALQRNFSLLLIKNLCHGKEAAEKSVQIAFLIFFRLNRLLIAR